MSGLLGTLSNGAQALATASQGVQIAGKNIANSTVQGYARQRMIVSSPGSVNTQVGIQSMAMRATGLQQLRDRFLDQQVAREVSGTGYLQAQSDNLRKAQIQLAEQLDGAAGTSAITDSTFLSSGTGAAITQFFNAFEQFATRPNDSSVRQLLIQKTDFLAERINLADERLASLQQGITSETELGVETANGLLKQIAYLNAEIEKVEINTPDGAVDLRDQRQAKLEQLAKYIDFTTREASDSNGQIEIVAKDTAAQEVVLLAKGTVRGSLAFDGTSFQGGTPATDLLLKGGSLAGNVAVRDGAIAQMRSDLKALADQLSTSVNRAYNPGGTGTDFFTTSASGLIGRQSGITASSLRASNSTDATANEIALAVASVASQEHSSSTGGFIDGSLNTFYSRSLGRFGQTISITQDSLEDQQTVERLITSQRDSVTTVAQDEELTDLMKYQRGFQASSRVINVVDNLLDVLINGIIR